jgi:hypothetical protein
MTQPVAGGTFESEGRVLKRRISAANVVSLFALIIAMGGTSYAAATLAAHSVGTRELKDGAVTNAKVRRGSLFASAFAAGQLTPVYACGYLAGSGECHRVATSGQFNSPTLAASLSLPAGNWLITGNVQGTPKDTGAYTLTCYPMRAGTPGVLDAQTVHVNGGNDAVIPIVVGLNLAKPTTFEVRCGSASADDFTYGQPSFYAVRIGSLHLEP